MTRINSAIKVQNLVDEMLNAEHREIKRLPFNYSHRSKNNKIPDKFTLGTGHVSFFYNKGKFTYNRYLDIRKECLERGFNATDYSSNWNIYKSNDYIDYVPTNEEYNLLIERISDRLMNSKKEYWHYKGDRISKEDAVKLLINKNI